MKNPLLYRSARSESSREASERFLMETLGRTQSERRRWLALAGGFRLLRLFGIDRLDAHAFFAVLCCHEFPYANEHFITNIVFQSKYSIYHLFFSSVRKMSRMFSQ